MILKNKLLIIPLFIVLLGVGAYVTYASTPPYDFNYGDQILIEGDLSAAGLSYNREQALIVKNLRNVENVIPGENFSTSMKEVMSVVIYNPDKGITSGDRGYDLIPLNEQIVRTQAADFNGNPDYVWDAVSTGQVYDSARYKIEHDLYGFSDWINLATIRDLSGGGGDQIKPTNLHSNQEWGYYNSGQTHRFDFNKAINRSTHQITNWPAIRDFKLNTGEELKEQSSIVLDLSTYGVYDKQMNAHLYLNGKTDNGWAISLPPVTNEYEMKIKDNLKVTDLPSEFLERLRANENGNDKNTLKFELEDGYGRTAEQEIQFIYKPIGDVYVIGDIIANPERKEFDGQDIPVEVTVRGTVVGLDEADISHWVISAKKEQDSYDRREIKTGSNITQEHTFTFLIPKSVMDGRVQEYIQNWIGQATVFDKNENPYTHDPIVTETIVYKEEDPEPPGPVCPPDVTPASSKIYSPRGSKLSPELIFDNDPKITFEVTSYQNLELENWRIEIRDEDNGRLAYRIMNETPINLIDRLTRNGVNWDMYELDMPEGLEKGVNYSISVRVKEEDGIPTWCGKTSDKRYFMLATRPVADFIFPEEIYAGDDIPLTNTSTHPDDLPMTAEWEVKAPRNIDSTGTDWDHEIVDSVIGYYDANLKVTDSLGGTDEIEYSIPVLDPKPQAILNITGTPKENRKVTIDGSRSAAPTRFPIDVSKTKITITPITAGVSTSKIKPSNIITETLEKDILIKKEGIYKVELYVENSRGSDTTEKFIVIKPDLIPYVSFSFADGQTIYTDPEDVLDGKPLASIRLQNESLSTDQDILQHKRWKVYFVESFNGDIPVFPNEPDIQFEESEITEEGTVFNILPQGLNPYISDVESCELCNFIVKKVDGQLIVKSSLFGYYLFELEVIEEFGQPTLEDFVTPEDRRRDTTVSTPREEKIFLIENRAPTVNWKE